MLELTHLPLSLLPTMVVPLIIASHVFLLVMMIRPWLFALAFRSAFNQTGGQ